MFMACSLFVCSNLRSIFVFLILLERKGDCVDTRRGADACTRQRSVETVVECAEFDGYYRLCAVKLLDSTCTHNIFHLLPKDAYESILCVADSVAIVGGAVENSCQLDT